MSEVTIADLVEAIPEEFSPSVIGDKNVQVRDATLDSREAKEGWLFIARPGQKQDGHDFIEQALANGANALLVQRDVKSDVPTIKVNNVSQALGFVAARLHGNPSSKLKVIGVTGTNGKTTTTSIIHHIVASNGLKAGLIGTVETRIGDKRIEGLRTTPEATDLQRTLARMVAEEIDVLAMEVSSHGIALGRINGIKFDGVGFTNLTQDHLDYHGSMEEYARAKARVFADDFTDFGAIVIGDKDTDSHRWSKRLIDDSNIETVSISQYEKADISISNINNDITSSQFDISYNNNKYQVELSIPGKFNIDNAVLAAILCERVGIELTQSLRSLSTIIGVPGRSQVVGGANVPFAVLVDYAHTPDAIENILGMANNISKGKVFIVVGSGGDRDKTKRPLMADSALNNSDYAFFTSDNPRTEDPEEILNDMVSHLDDNNKWETIVLRQEAIAKAINVAQPGDVVVIAGKGHETYQEINGVKHPFDDVKEAEKAISNIKPIRES